MTQHHGQMAKWILTKLCKHNPWVAGKVYHPKTPECGTPSGENWI